MFNSSDVNKDVVTLNEIILKNGDEIVVFSYLHYNVDFSKDKTQFFDLQGNPIQVDVINPNDIRDYNTINW